MKKTLLLSVVASTMIMAGGTIGAPVEPVVETPAVAATTSDWDFSGQAVVYYQTTDAFGNGDLFEQDTSRANAGLQLRAVNKNLFSGIGAGVEVNGLATLGLQEDVVAGVMQSAGTADARGGWISQAYLTYATGKTNFKVGRQELPKALSPFAFSEGWNVFKNTFDAALVVNSDIQDTTLVGAIVAKANYNGLATDMSQFTSVNPDGEDDNFIYMLTAQNKSINDLTLTGSYYYAPDVEGIGNEDINILWGDAKFGVAGLNMGLQGGTIMSDALADDGVAFGAKASTTLGAVNASIAYSSTDENANFKNVGGVKTPLYTQMVLNQGIIQNDADYIKAGVSTKALNGKFIVNYGYAVNNNDDIAKGADNNPAELDVIYKTKVFNNSTTLLAAYVMVDPDVAGKDNLNVIRVWGRYNF